MVAVVIHVALNFLVVLLHFFLKRRYIMNRYYLNALCKAGIVCWVVLGIAGSGWAEIPTVNVTKCIVEGSAVTKAQMESWFQTAKDNWAPYINFVQTEPVKYVAKVGDGKVEGNVNVYGTSLAVAPPGNAGLCHGWDYIEVGPGAAQTTLKHELGHWFGAYPDHTNSEHGNLTAPGEYPGFPGTGYFGYDTDGDGDCDAADQDNIMFPGTGRTGHAIDPIQGLAAQNMVRLWNIYCAGRAAGKAKEETDKKGDSPNPSTDLNFTRTYCDTGSPDRIRLIAHVEQYLPHITLGFLIDSDQNLSTGEPGTGIDYRLQYSWGTDTITFEIHDGISWVPVVFTGIQRVIQNLEWDGPFPDTPIGVELFVPKDLFTRRGPTEIMSTQTFATDGVSTDFAPDASMIQISTDPIPGPTTLSGTINYTPYGPGGYPLQGVLINVVQGGVVQETHPVTLTGPSTLYSFYVFATGAADLVIDPDPATGWFGDATGVVLVAAGTATADFNLAHALPGDADMDGQCWDSDVDIINGCYGIIDGTAVWCIGDFDDDGNVYDSDVDILNGCYGLGHVE